MTGRAKSVLIAFFLGVSITIAIFFFLQKRSGDRSEVARSDLRGSHRDATLPRAGDVLDRNGNPTPYRSDALML